ncbi:MAG: hypothetical protein HKO76_08050 [Acidimicrobiia bacterium]|nr:hypothetical protein [Acidimicrobiia bacterium]NNL74567.1 hypothetical protein [Silicimonas sp.]RZW12785.1 MAG: hypothetical protein EX266_00065 [Paracoccaceae bacterium]
MIRAATVLALVAATPANALSCLAPDAVRLYTQAAESDALFAIVTGRLHPDGEVRVPEVDANSQKNAEATTRVRMTGKVLGSQGFAQEFEREIDVTVTCLSIWCGTAITDQDILAAVRLTDDAPVLEVGPCGGMAIPLEGADVDGLLRCHRTGDCPPM